MLATAKDAATYAEYLRALIKAGRVGYPSSREIHQQLGEAPGKMHLLLTPNRAVVQNFLRADRLFINAIASTAWGLSPRRPIGAAELAEAIHIHSAHILDRREYLGPEAASALYGRVNAQRVLDIGAGYGGGMLGALESGVVEEYVGVDPEEELFIPPTTTATQCRVQIIAKGLPEGGLYSFDAVVVRAAGAKKAWRYVKPGGYMCILLDSTTEGLVVEVVKDDSC
jgi:protein-L-isoaspartate O-methyltransferase